MERHAHAASLFNTINHLFRRGQSSSADEQVNSAPQLAGVPSTPFQSPASIQLDQGHEVTSFPPSHITSEDVEMPPVDLWSDTPNSNSHPALSTFDSSQLTSSPHTGAPATSSHSETPEIPHPFLVDDDARSDASMPPLYDASDSESEEHHFYNSEDDAMSESDADAYEIEMTLLADDEDPSDNEESVLQNENAPPLPFALPATAASGGSHRHVVVEEVEDQDQPRTNTIPPENSGQPVTPSHFEMHAHWHHPPRPHTHTHPQPQPQFQPHPQHQQPPHQPHPPQPNGGFRLPNFPPNFPAMPGLRAQGHVEGPVPLPGLRTLFQPLIAEAVAQAGERFRTAQAAGGPTFGQGPAMGPPPFVQVTFDVPVFRVPADPSTRQQQQQQPPQANTRSGADARRQADQTFEHERAFAAPPLGSDIPGSVHNTPPMPTPNPNPIPTDAVPPALRQLFEAAFDTGPGEPPTTDGPQIGATPGWTGLMGLLFGLGLGASHEFHREDPARAKRLVKGLEAVNAGLVKRMRKISEGSADGSICAICWDALLEEDSEISPNWAANEPVGDVPPDHGQATNPESDAANSVRPESESEPEEPLPKVIALPCSHVFHSACLVPWFSRPKQTTCPTCRFNVDPENLTYEPPRRPQSDTREQPQQQRPIPQQPVAPQQGGQGQQEFPFGMAPPPQPAAPQQDGHPMPPPPFRRTIFEHTFAIPLPPAAFPPPHPQPVNPSTQTQPEMRQQGIFPVPGAATEQPSSPLALQHALQILRSLGPHALRPHPPPNGAPGQEGPAPPPVPLQPHPRPPPPTQGLQPPPQEGQRNNNGMPRFPGLFQFDLPQIVRMPDGSWLWSAPLGGIPSPATAGTPQPPPRPAAPKRAWVPPPPPGLTLRQRVEQGERERGLRCDDVSCGLGPSDDDPEPTADLARVIIHSLGDSASGCGHTFHPACLVSAERVAGWGPDSESERERTGGMVEVSCPVCRAVGVVPGADWEKGAEALA